MGSYESLIPAELRNLDEAALEQALFKIGVDFVLQDPGRYILLSLSRIPAYFMFWPSPDSGLVSNISRVGSFGVLLPFMIFGFARALQKQKGSITSRLDSPLFLLVVFIAIYTLIHLLTWALIRYRLPVDAVLVIFAGFAFVEIYSWVQKKRILNPGQV
jgi:fumarate reductase subunit D